MCVHVHIECMVGKTLLRDGRMCGSPWSLHRLAEPDSIESGTEPARKMWGGR